MAPGLLARAGRPGSPGAVSSHAPLSPEAGLPFPTARSGCRSCLWRALLVTLRPRMSNGSLQKVQFSEDDGRNNVAMQAAPPAATNIKMMQGLELKSQVHKGSMDGRNKWQTISSPPRIHRPPPPRFLPELMRAAVCTRSRPGHLRGNNFANLSSTPSGPAAAKMA